MHKMTKNIIFIAIMGILLPMLVFKIAQRNGKSNSPPEHEKQKVLEVIQTENPTQETLQNSQANEMENEIIIPVIMDNGSVVNMVLDAYITGVVLAEMPSDFEPEALKAQAVVARTYTLKHCFETPKHPDGALCVDPSCCQAYCDSDDYIESGGRKTCIDKVSKAVMDTKNMVLTFNSELIDATYFSCSGGRTEDAKDVWGADVPYLQAVDSPGEENAARYMDTVYFTLEEFADCMQIPTELLTGRWIGKITYTDGGGVAEILICGQPYSGIQMRNLLGLRSTAFVISAVGNCVTVTTKGFGHRVGMSQYGADAMAVAGSSYTEILTHYYQGTKIEKFVV